MMENVVLQAPAIGGLLEPFGIRLTDHQADQLRTYLELLLRWNERINLTGIRDPAECVVRHFGESLYLGLVLRLDGRLMDIGTGAGFPGLALKITSPALRVFLLEPNAKKSAFLKEVVRECGFSDVEVRRARIEDYADEEKSPAFDLVTMRAVGEVKKVLPLAAGCLVEGGSLCLWTTSEIANEIRRWSGQINWSQTAKIPRSRERVILIGRKASG